MYHGSLTPTMLISGFPYNGIPRLKITLVPKLATYCPGIGRLSLFNAIPYRPERPPSLAQDFRPALMIEILASPEGATSISPTHIVHHIRHYIFLKICGIRPEMSSFDDGYVDL